MKPHYTGELYKQNTHPDLIELVENGDWHSLEYADILELYSDVEQTGTAGDRAYLGAVDRYYLFTCIMGRMDALHPWLFDRCREVELSPDGHLDLWARDHYKSSLITLSGTIQEVLNNPEITIGIFSHTKPIAKAFVNQIKRELEGNDVLRSLYPNVVWRKPSMAPKWSDTELIVQRVSNPKEATIEAHGLVDGQPTGKHFFLRVYDDVVTRENVTTPDQVRKTTEAWELSNNLGSGDNREWYIGTRYSFGDTYGEMLNRGVVEPRIYPATHNGQADGMPVFLSDKIWNEKKKIQVSTLNAQMLQNPLAGKERMFLPGWFRPYEIRPSRLNVYIMGDPSKGSNNRSDNTAIMVVGIDANFTKYLLDGFCHRMKMSERWKNLLMLHKKWSKEQGVTSVKVGWERFGQQTDDEYFEEKMRQAEYFFSIEELAWPRDNTFSKTDRVERLQPDFQYSRFYLPALAYRKGKGFCTWKYNETRQVMEYTKVQGDSKLVQKAKEKLEHNLVAKPIRRVDENGEVYDLTTKLIDEMLFFPFSPHDDAVDATSRIYDMNPISAKDMDEDMIEEDVYEDA